MQAKATETHLWTKLDVLFKEKSFQEISHALDFLLGADLDIDQLCRSAKVLSELHFKNKADPQKRLASGYAFLTALGQLRLGKTGLAVSTIDWLKKIPGTELSVRHLEEAISKGKAQKNIGSPGALREKTKTLVPLTAGTGTSRLTESISQDSKEALGLLASEAESAFKTSFESSKTPPPRQIELFSKILVPLEVQALLEKVKVIHLTSNEILFNEGDSATGFYIVADGTLEFDNHLQTKLTFGVHDSFGEIALLTNSRRTGTVRAKTACQLLEFSKELLVEKFIEFPKLEDKIVQLLHWRLFLNIASQTSLFSKFKEEELSDFYAFFEPVFSRAGTTIFREGQESSALLLLVVGQLAIRRNNSEIAVMHPGAFVGELGLLSSQPRSATVSAKTDCRYLICKDYMFDSLLQRYPDVQPYLLGISNSLNYAQVANVGD